MSNQPQIAAPGAVQSGEGLGALLDFIKAKIVAAEKAVKFREDSYKTWRGGTDASWRAVGCYSSKAVRLKTSDAHGRIAIKRRRELEMFRAVLERLQAPNGDYTNRS